MNLSTKQVIISSIIFLLLDFLYLSTFGSFFNKLIYAVQGSPLKFNLFGAIVCYILLIYGLNYFILREKRSIKDAFLLGIIIYGVYETTNYAILNKWSLKSVAIDTLWGGILFAITTNATYRIIGRA
jgi:uncharacterized membrane protein